MTCHHVTLPNGARAIVCTATNRCQCGRKAELQCDWKVPSRKSGTCDKWICDRCTTSPAPNKDLCKKHAAEYETWKAKRRG